MKCICSFLLGITLLWVSPVFSQVTPKGLLVIKNGSVLQYTAMDQGSLIHFPVAVLSRGKDGVVFQYSVSHGDKSFSGKIYVMGAAVESGGSLNQNGLNPGEERKLTADETIFFFSKQFYKDLLKNKTAKYSNVQYALMKVPAGKEIFIGKKKVNALYMYSKDAGTAYWVLNDPEFPLILKSDGNKSGPDLTLADVTTK